MDTLKDFYWDCYQIVQRDVPQWITVFHDSFRLKFDVWGKFMVNCPNYAIDTHIYQAWFEAAKPEMFQEQACSAGAGLRLFEDAGVPIVSPISSSFSKTQTVFYLGTAQHSDNYSRIFFSVFEFTFPCYSMLCTIVCLLSHL